MRELKNEGASSMKEKQKVTCTLLAATLVLHLVAEVPSVYAGSNQESPSKPPTTSSGWEEPKSGWEEPASGSKEPPSWFEETESDHPTPPPPPDSKPKDPPSDALAPDLEDLLSKWEILPKKARDLIIGIIEFFTSDEKPEEKPKEKPKPPQPEPDKFSFQPEIVSKAMSTPLISFADQERGTNQSIAYQAKSFYFLVLTTHFNPEAKDTSGKLVKDQALAHIRNLISGGKEPHASGNLAGWSHNMVAQTLVLSKNTPAIWNSLSSEEKTKIDWLMKALAIAANWGFHDSNDFSTGLDQGGNFKKTFNPNYRNGYGNVVIATSLYFGSKELNTIYTSFQYDEYMKQLKQYGFTNITSTWEKTGKELMENGGQDTFGGSGKGVKQPFTYQQVPLDQLFGIFEKLALFTYDQVVTDSGADGKAYILSQKSSPYKGKKGMMREFNSKDSGGPRSDALYCYESWMNQIPTRTNLQLLGHWGDGSAQKNVEELMDIGSKDLIFKLEQGYHSYSLGTEKDVTVKEASDRGYDFDKEIWDRYINGKSPSPPQDPGDPVKPPPPVITPPPSDSELNGEPLRRAKQLMSLFEHGTTDLTKGYSECYQLYDGRGYTCGIIGFTSGTGSVYEVTERYNEVVPNNLLSPYLDELKDKDGDDVSGLDGFTSAWKQSVKDPKFIEVQDEIAYKNYYKFAADHAKKVGIQTSLGKAIFYDSLIQHGDGDDPDSFQALIERTSKKMNGTPKSGIDERTWIFAFLDVRRADLEHAYEESTREEWAESVDRVDSLKEIANSGNFDLNGPIIFKWEGRSYKID